MPAVQTFPAPTRPSVEWVAGGQNAKDRARQRHFGTTPLRLIENTLERAGLRPAGRRLQVVSTFLRSSALPPVSGVLADAHGCRLRVKPTGDDQGYLVVVLCDAGETPEALAAKLEPAAKHVSAGTTADPVPPPDSEPVYRQAAGIAARIDRAASLADFATQVAEEVGPGEDPHYWMRALTAAESHGLLLRNGTTFYPSGTVEADIAPVAADPAPSPTPPPRPAADAASSDVDAGALEALAGSAGGLIAALSRLQKLNDERKDLQKKRLELDAKLAENTRQLKEAARGIDFDTLALSADAIAK